MDQEDLNKLIAGVTGKRPRAVLDHILAHGRITTEELKEQYGYNHPPRAARDVREQGIPLVTFNVVGSDGRRIAAYKFGDPADASATKSGGRQAFSRAFKLSLVSHQGEKCALCGIELPARGLQIDHRVPFEVGGEGASRTDLTAFMLLCNSCNRAKSWSCEACTNLRETKDVATCMSCYWGSPEDYSHVAMADVRRLEMVWQHEDISEYERLARFADAATQSLSDYVKSLLREDT